ncbi:hypothetical protein BGZ94_005753 [Podila epigama]|nr:hypothetical protein BGZ94_005753 [Podila epigama]
MGAKHSKENKDLARRTHFSKREIHALRREFEKTSNSSRSSVLTEAQFKEASNILGCPSIFRRILHSSPLDDVFLTRLFSAFDTNPDSKGVNFKDFIEGLSIFMKGTSDEKLELSFKLYDIDHAGYITRPGLERAMTQLHSVVAGSSQDETHQIQELVKRIFDDLDVNNDGKLSLEEYKLNSMKEPLIIDFLGQFLADQTDSGANSICSALSVPPSPRTNSSPPSPRFGHFAPPSPRLRDSIYGTVGTTAGGHVLQTSSPAGSFRLSNSHSLLWLNGGINGSGDLLGKVNEFEGLVAAEEQKQQEQGRKVNGTNGTPARKTAAQVAADIESSLSPVVDVTAPAAGPGTESTKSTPEKVEPVVIISSSEEKAENQKEKEETTSEQTKVNQEQSVDVPVTIKAKTTQPTVNVEVKAPCTDMSVVSPSTEAPDSPVDEVFLSTATDNKVDTRDDATTKPKDALPTPKSGSSVEETTQSLDIVQH